MQMLRISCWDLPAPSKTLGIPYVFIIITIIIIIIINIVKNIRNSLCFHHHHHHHHLHKTEVIIKTVQDRPRTDVGPRPGMISSWRLDCSTCTPEASS